MKRTENILTALHLKQFLIFPGSAGHTFSWFYKKKFSSPDDLALHMQELQMHLGQILFRSPQKESLEWEAVAA